MVKSRACLPLLFTVKKQINGSATQAFELVQKHRRIDQTLMKPVLSFSPIACLLVSILGLLFARLQRNSMTIR